MERHLCDLSWYGGWSISYNKETLWSIERLCHFVWSFVTACTYKKLYKKLSCRRGTARRAMLVNSCYVSRDMGARNISNSKSDLQGHSRALAMVSFDRPYVRLDFHCNHVSILHRFRDTINYFPKLRGHVTLNTSLSVVIYHSCTCTPLYQSAHGIWSA